MSLFSVSRLIGKGRSRSSKRTSSVKDTAQGNEGSQSQQRGVVDSAPSTVIAVTSPGDEPSKANSQPETIPEEPYFSLLPVSSRKREVTQTHERKTEVVEEAGYDVVLQPSAKASFGDWTELDTGKKASGPATEALDAECAQFGIDRNAKEEFLPKASNSCTPLSIGERAEEPARKPSIPDWTHLEIDKSSPNLPSEAEWLQLNIDKKTKEGTDVTALSAKDSGGIISEARVNEERAAHLEEMRIVNEEKEKLAERVKELEEELCQAEHELRLKVAQISKFVIDLDRKEEEIEALKVAAREKEESLDEIRQHVAEELKVVELQNELDTDLAESRARVAELESTNELQAKKLLEQDVTLASHIDIIAVLKGQKANLFAQVHTLRATAKVNERQNSMLMAQLKQQSDDLVAGNIPIVTKSGRRTTGSTLVEQAVRTIKGLNDEIYQTAASLTDCVDEIEKRFVDESDGTAAALETLKSLLGTEIYNELNEERYMKKDEYNPFILQTGFQACLTACCMRIITSWYPAEPEYGKFLEAVYERIRGLGGAENAHQWRKWTLKSCTFSTNKDVLFEFITDNLYAMLSMSGWPKLGEMANLQDKFGGKISEIVNLAVRLNTLAAEAPMPGDLQATTIEERKDYLSQDMADHTPEGGWDSTQYDTPYSQVVMACVGLGLKWRADDMNEARLVLKPWVILRKVHKPRWAYA